MHTIVPRLLIRPSWERTSACGKKIELVTDVSALLGQFIQLGPAAWYSCLILSLFAIMLSSSEDFIFSNFRKPRPALTEQSLDAEVSMIIRLDRCPRGGGGGEEEQRRTPPGERNNPGRQRRLPHSPPPPRALLRWNTVFTWQAPMMLLSYSVVAFLTGVSVYACTPLFSDDDALSGKAVRFVSY